MIELRTTRQIVSDEDIERVHGNANFGSLSKRGVVDEGVLTAAFGFHCGSTMRAILQEHRLTKAASATERGRFGDRMRLTQRGFEYLRALFGNVPAHHLLGLRRSTGGPRLGINDEAAKEVIARIDAVAAAGLADEAKLFETIYSAWLRLTDAYVNAHPYVGKPERSMTPISALSVTDFTLRHWAEKIPGTPKLDDEAVLREAAEDEAWHREEDRRMRRDAGDDV
ncbi:MAG TPA: hypothetical protein VIM56_03820 [Rhizomicrobium sp.]